MKEIIKAIKKNWKDLLVFLICMVFGLGLSFGAMILVFRFTDPLFESRYLSECAYALSDTLNFKKEGLTNVYTAGYYYSPDEGYNYPEKLDCKFSEQEKNIGIDVIYKDNQDVFSTIINNSHKVEDLKKFRNELGNSYYADGYDFEKYKLKLIDILGEDKIKDLKTSNELMTLAYKNGLDITDINDSLYLKTQNEISDENLRLKLNKLLEDNNTQYNLNEKLSMLIIIFSCLFLAIFIYIIGYLPFINRFKKLLIYIIYGVVVFGVYVLLYLLFDLLDKFF